MKENRKLEGTITISGVIQIRIAERR
jgi:hypothetical protein